MRYETNTFQQSLLPNFPSKNKTARNCSKLLKIIVQMRLASQFAVNNFITQKHYLHSVNVRIRNNSCSKSTQGD